MWPDREEVNVWRAVMEKWCRKRLAGDWHLPFHHNCKWLQMCPPCWTPVLCRSSQCLLLVESVCLLTPPTTPRWQWGQWDDCWGEAVNAGRDRTARCCNKAPPLCPCSSALCSDRTESHAKSLPKFLFCFCPCFWKWVCPVPCGCGGWRLMLTAHAHWHQSWLDVQWHTRTKSGRGSLREKPKGISSQLCDANVTSWTCGEESSCRRREKEPARWICGEAAPNWRCGLRITFHLTPELNPD